MHLGGGQGVATQRCHQRVEQLVPLVHPAAHGGAIDDDAVAGVDAALPVEGDVVAVLRHHHMRDQRGSGHAARDRPARGRGLEDRLARDAGELGPHMTDGLEVRGNVLQLLGDILADQAQSTSAGGAPTRLTLGVVVVGCRVRTIDLRLARQVWWRLTIAR